MNTDVNLERLRFELDELHDTRNSIDRLIERKKLLMLKALSRVHGFENTDALIGALAQFASKELRERIDAVAQASRLESGRGRRYSGELRVAVREALEAGESAAEIVRATVMSVATVIRWKRLWHLGSHRGLARRAGATTAEWLPGTETTMRAGQTNGSREDWAL